MGLPGLRGLGPGAVEDAQNALDPRPILGAVFGSGYPDCEEVIRRVGDQFNRIRNPVTGKSYVENPGTVFDGNLQKRWVQKLDGKSRPMFLTKEEYEAKRAIKDAEGEATERLTEAYQRNTGRKPTVAQLEAVVALDKNVQNAHKNYAKVLGFTLITEICIHVTDAVNSPKLPFRIQHALIQNMIGVLRIAFDQKIQSDGGNTGQEILNKLKKFLP
jgi:hypothetical protein